MDFTLGIIMASDSRASIQLAAWNSYAASNSDFTDSVCHRLNGTVLRPNAKDINVDGKQAVILWWLEPGAVVVHFKAGHRAVATSAAKFVAAALDAQFVPVSGHFSEIERMIFDIGDHAAIIQFRGNDAGSRLAILEHTVAHRGEFLYLHYIDSATLSASPLTRVSIDSIAAVSASTLLRSAL